jgi:uncharacterized protein YndB with AHSA1/START domain
MHRVTQRIVESEPHGTAGREIVTSRLVDAPREVVWEAFTDPKQVVLWWGPRGFTTTIHEMDVRPGGTWSHTMRGPDGAEYPNKSTFTEVVKPERIVYGHGGGKKGGPGVSFEATWTFEAKGNKTLLTGRMVFPTAEARELVVREFGAIEGGRQTMDRLQEQLDQNSVVVERTYNASAKTIWAAITELDQMKQWYMKEINSFKPEVGFETEFSVRHEGKEFPHLWKVTEVVPEKKITYDWRFAGNSGISYVTFELIPHAERTRLKITHTGLESFNAKNNPDLARRNFQQGWLQLVDSLEKHIGSPTVAPAAGPLVITRTFDAPRELVWKAWTDPERMKLWWGPERFTAPACRMDLRVGGRFHFCMRSPQGQDFWNTGEYLEIVKPLRLVYTDQFADEKGNIVPASHYGLPGDWPQETVVTVTFEEINGKTKMTLRHAGITAGVKSEMTGAGWNGSFDKLAASLLKA